MGLMVFIITKDNNIDTEELERQMPSNHNFLFGFETFRKTVWGNDIMKELGCNMIYSLKDSDICAFWDDLQELKRELNIILRNINILKFG